MECPDCGGSGERDPLTVADGEKVRIRVFEDETMIVICPTCKGTGKVEG